jgi:hypothetical protein
MATKIEKKVEYIPYFRFFLYLCAVQSVENDDETITDYHIAAATNSPLCTASGHRITLQAD